MTSQDPKIQQDVEPIELMEAPQKADRDLQPELRTYYDDLPVWASLKVYKRLAIVCAIAAFSASCDGYQGHFNGSVVANKGFIQQFGTVVKGKRTLDAHWVSIWGGCSSAGNFVSQFLIVYVNDFGGRRAGLWVTWVLLLTSTLAESFVTNNVGWLFAKLLSGLGVGAMQGTLPMYLSEMAPTQLRGLFTQSYTFWFVVGQLLSSVPLQWFSEHDPLNFRTPIRIQFALIGILMVIYVFLPESPKWYIQRGKSDKALKGIQRLYKGIPGLEPTDVLAVMEATIVEERKHHAATSGWGFEIFKGINGWRLLIACWPKVLQQFVGLSVFNTYATYFFAIAGYSNPFEITVILSCVQLMSMIGTMAVVDVWGRRSLCVYGYLVTVLADFGMGATGFYDLQRSAVGGLLVFFACLATFSTTSASAIGYSYLAEIPKQDLRAKSAGWGLAISNLFSIMFSYCTPLMIGDSTADPKWGVKTGLFFGSTGFVCVVVGWFIIPETAKRTPAEIDEMFESKVNPRHFKGYVTEVQRNATGEHPTVVATNV